MDRGSHGPGRAGERDRETLQVRESEDEMSETKQTKERTAFTPGRWRTLAHPVETRIVLERDPGVVIAMMPHWQPEHWRVSHRLQTRHALHLFQPRPA